MASACSPNGGAARRDCFTRNGNDLTEAFPEVARAVAACPMTDVHHRWRSGDARRQGSSRTSSACSSGPGCGAARHPPRGGGIAGDALRLRPARARGLRPPHASAGRAEGASSQRVVPPPARSATSTTSRSEGEAFFARWSGMGLEGIIAKKADAPTRGGGRRVAQDQGGTQRRFRGRGLHRAEGQPRRVRRAAPGAVHRKAAGVCRTGGQRLR